MGTTQGLTPVPAPRLAPSWGWILAVALVTVALVGMLVAAGGWWGRAAPSLVPATAPAVVPPVGSPTPAATPAATATPDSTETPVPTVSPDWTAPPIGRIAFVRDGDIWVVDPASGEPARNLTATADVREAAAAWSPDGTRLAYLVEDPDFFSSAFPAGRVYALWTMDADGGDAHQLFPALEPGGSPIRSHLDLSWSPNGRVVGWTRYVGMALTGATLVGVDGGYRDFPATVTWHVTRSGFQNPVFSPDGSRVAFSVSRGFRDPGAAGVYVAGTDLEGVDAPELLDATLTLGDVLGESIDWLDPTALIFVANGGLWEIQADGTNLVRLSPMDLRVEHALASPDGSAIAFVAESRLYVMSTGGTLNGRGFFPAGLIEVGDICDAVGTPTRSLAWSPDGRYVAFPATVEGGCALAWVSAEPAVMPAIERWSEPGFFDPDIWDGPIEVAPTVTDLRLDPDPATIGETTPMSWGP